MKRAVALDLFCGAGGLTRGLLDAGIEVALGVDVDESCRYVYERNNYNAKFLKADVSRLNADLLQDAWRGATTKILAGCAPCQPFSTYTQGQSWQRSSRWKLLQAFARLAEDTLPDVVAMENVGTLSKHGAFRSFCETLKKNDYEVVWDVVDCRHYGIPQSRRRLVLLASRLGTPSLPKPSHPQPEDWITVRQAISHYPSLNAGEQHKDDNLHMAARLSDMNLKRIRASRPGGTWRDWPKSLVAPCHKKQTGSTYPAVYGRMEWDKPSPTITGQCFGYGNGRFGHPEQDRAITLREAAILQSFPPEYQFSLPTERPSISIIGQMIGNAVPPALGKALGRAINSHLKRAVE